MALKGSFYIVLLFIPLACSTEQSADLVVGGLLSENIVETVFKQAINYVNNRTDILPNHKLKYVVRTLNTLDAYQYIQSGYDLLEEGVSAVVGPEYSSLVRATHYMFQETHVPQITQYATDSYLTTDKGLYQYLLKMSPPDSVEMEALAAVVTHFKWSQVALLASNNDYGRHAVHVFTRLAIKMNIVVLAEETFVPMDNIEDVNVVSQLNSIKQKAATVIILVTELQFTPLVLLQAKENGMLDKNYLWILYETILDMGPELTNELQGILGIRAVSTEGSLAHTYTQLMGNSPLLHMPHITRTFDSVLALAYALDKYTKDGHELTPYSFSRTNKTTSPWKDGKTLMNYLSQVSRKGVTNDIKFSSSLTPVFAKYNIVNLQKTGWVTVATWDKKDGLTMNNNTEPIFRGQTNISPIDMSYDLTGIHFNLAALIFPPFTIKITTNGVEEFGGYNIDLLKRLATELKFNYTVYLAADGKFGSQDATTHEWNGMVGDVLNKRADIGLTALTVTKERLQYIEFSNPYMSAPLGILMAKAENDATMTAFLDPFTSDLWGTVIALLVAFSIVLCIIASFSPYDYGGKFRWRQDKSDMTDKEDSSRFNLYNSTWCMICTLLMQGPENFPRSMSARIVTAFFWFTVYVITASYTANLTAFLTVNRLESPIGSVYDLANQETILYGASNDGIEETFFSSSNSDPYTRMYDFMNIHNTWFDSFDEGLEWVRSGKVRDKTAKFAMIGDEPYLRYIAAAVEPCNTILAKSPFWSGQYALAFRKNSPYISAFNFALTKLGQDGVLDELKTKWVLKGKCNNFKADAESTEASKDTLDAYKLRGVFVVCAIGFGFGFIVLLVECMVFKLQSNIHKEMPSNRQNSTTKDDSIEFYSTHDEYNTRL